MIDLNKKIISINSNKKFENELKSDCVIDIRYQENTNTLEMLQNKSKINRCFLNFSKYFK